MAEQADSLLELLRSRGVTVQAAAVLADRDKSTISRQINGKMRPDPAVIVALARALGVDAGRMKRMFDAAYQAAQEPAGVA